MGDAQGNGAGLGLAGRERAASLDRAGRDLRQGGGGCLSSASRASWTAVSSCGSRPAAASSGVISTSTSGSTPWFSTPQPYRSKWNANLGTVTVVPSTRPWRPSMPITPPQVRVPTTGPEAEQLDRGRDDVAVGPGELVGHGDQRAAPRLPRVGLRLQPAAQAPADDAPGQLLHHQLGDVPAAVPAHVEDEPVAGHLGLQVAVEVRPALPHHVRDVQVAEPPLAQLADQPAPSGHPVLIAQPPVRAQRHDHDATADFRIC